MSYEFEFPDTGEGVTEGQFLEWLVEEGEEIEEDQVVGEAETDKAVVDIPAPVNGVVESLEVSPGDEVEVGEVIMVLDEGGSAETGSDSKEEETGEVEETGDGEEPEEEAEIETGSDSGEEVLALPRVRKKAEEEGVELSEVKDSGRVTMEELEEYIEGVSGESSVEDEESEEAVEDGVEEDSGGSTADRDVNASPSVRQLAREKGVDIRELEGSGRGGKVVRNDVVEAASGGVSSAGKTCDAGKAGGPGETGGGGGKEGKTCEGQEGEFIELSRYRRKTAEKMAESKSSIPHVTHFDKVDVTELRDLREEWKEEVDTHLTYLPFIMKAVSIALRDFPEFRSEFQEDEGRLRVKEDHDINVAVDTDKGLVNPVVEDVDRSSIVEVAETVVEKAEKAREDDLDPVDLKVGSFSVTNIGAIGGDEFTPIIFQPQTAILGIGEIKRTAEAVGVEVEPRWTVKLSLSYDHRAIDGADAARFMNTVKENLENPEEMMLEI